jgi:hypothetical protein
VKVIQVCSNEGPGRFQSGDDYKNAKIGCAHLKVFLLVASGPEKFKFI